MNGKVRLQLSTMMFLEFFIWGAWYVPMGVYLGKLDFPGTVVGSAYSTTAIAAIISPFFVGMVADRFFSAERVLGIVHLLGGLVLFAVSNIVTPMLFFWVLLVYTLTYMPTLALVNAVSFHQMEDTEKQFPKVRVWGTIGWIVAGLIVGFLELNDGGARLNIESLFGLDLGIVVPFAAGEGDWVTAAATSFPMRLAGVAAILLGLYSFLLPHTPPKAKGERISVRDVLGLDALGLMKDRSFAVFVISSFLICIPLAAYYGFANMFLDEAGMANATAKMTLGQMSEAAFLLVMPFLFTRLGVKKMLLFGMIAWIARYIFFAFGNNEMLVWMFYGGIVLHGICYDFFFVTGQIYVDNEAPRDIRANAQGFIAMVTYGIGMYIGSILAGWIVQQNEIHEAEKIVGHSWVNVWLIMAVLATVVTVFFAIFFKDKVKPAAEPEAQKEAETT